MQALRNTPGAARALLVGYNGRLLPSGRCSMDIPVVFPGGLSRRGRGGSVSARREREEEGVAAPWGEICYMRYIVLFIIYIIYNNIIMMHYSGWFDVEPNES